MDRETPRLCSAHASLQRPLCLTSLPPLDPLALVLQSQVWLECPQVPRNKRHNMFCFIDPQERGSCCRAGLFSQPCFAWGRWRPLGHPASYESWGVDQGVCLCPGPTPHPVPQHRRWLWGLLTRPGILLSPPTLLSPPRTQMTSWWPRPSARAMTRTWRSVNPVLVSAFPPSPAPGPLRR